MILTRTSPKENYRGIFNTKTGKTFRIALNSAKEIKPLKFPELLDISLGTKCYGNCSYCYAGGSPTGKHYPNVVNKIRDWFGVLPMNQRPFQVAIGGEGEPTLHPEFVEVLQTLKELGITPNYTTNGMHLHPHIIEATKQYCGGVAVSCHSHLPHHWKSAVWQYTKEKVRTNLHIVIGEAGSVEYFHNIYKDYCDKVDYFVLLPYQRMGRAPVQEVSPQFTKLFQSLPKNAKYKVAFGALFYDFIKNNPDVCQGVDINLYEPEVFSGYVRMCDNELVVRKSSFNPRVKNG